MPMTYLNYKAEDLFVQLTKKKTSGTMIFILSNKVTFSHRNVIPAINLNNH